MKAAIYYPWIYLTGGIERTIMELKKRSRHDWTIYTSRYDGDNTYPELKGMGVVQVGRVSVKRDYLSVLKAGLRLFTTRLDLDGHKVLFICCDGLGSFITFRNRSKPVVCLCFTPLRAVYDEKYRERHLKKHRRLLPLALVVESAYRLLDRLAWKNYSHVFCISSVVRDRVLSGRLCAGEKIEIAYPGIDGSKAAPSLTRQEYFFLPGRVMWTKNIELGISAFLEFKKATGSAFKLVVAGMVDAKSAAYVEKLKAMAAGSADISFIAGPSEERMEELYRNCYAVLFTAFNEDYGLTVLEGMSHGKPVIAVNSGGPTEVVVNGKTGILDPAAFSSAMRSLVDDPDRAAAMGEMGLERSRSFTWERFVEQIDAYLDGLEAGGLRLPGR